MQEMKSPTFKKTTDDDLINDLKYFWSKTRSLMEQLKAKGYVLTLTDTQAQVAR